MKESHSVQLTLRGTRASRMLLVSALCCYSSCMLLFGQNSAVGSPVNITPQSADAQNVADIERRLDEVTAALGKTNQEIKQYVNEIQVLRAQLDALRPKSGEELSKAPLDATSTTAISGGSSAIESAEHDQLTELHDEQVAQQAEIKQLDQTKVEVSSKYPLRVRALVLFNAFSNAGVVDDAELPAIALYRYPGSSHGSNGATLRQTILGLEAFGPRFAGARTTAQVGMDFFGASSSNASGYSPPAGTLRMRQAKVSMDWERSTITAGYTGPLISPLSPASFATVAEPSLSGSGNLWTWSPQLSIEQRIALSEERSLGVEAGLIYPASPGYSSMQLVSPIEASRRPAYEGRFSYRAVSAAKDSSNHLVLGLGAYSGQQFYSSYTRVHSWAVTGDWDIPFSSQIELSGEIYRGRAIGGLGGGAYKDILIGTDTVTGLPRIAAVEAVGGWSQVKFKFAPSLEANAIFGMDDALAKSFDQLLLDPATNPLGPYARNSSVVGNLIFRPKTYLLFSPEYRRIRSWRYTGPANVADIFTISAGYQF
jgi:hypothetical protein